MLDFIGSVLGFAIDPLTLGGSAFIGYLFYEEVTKLAWSLLLFVLPGLGSVESVSSHGLIYDSVAQLMAAAALTLVFCKGWETLATRRRALN